MGMLLLEHQLPLRSRDGGGTGGPVHDDRRADPAAGDADGPATGSIGFAFPASAPAPTASTKTVAGSLEPHDPAPTRTSVLLSGGLLLILCIPTLSLRLGSNDAGTEPANKTTRQAYDLLAEGFGPGFNGPLMIVARCPAGARRRASPDLPHAQI